MKVGGGELHNGGGGREVVVSSEKELEVWEKKNTTGEPRPVNVINE